MERHNVNSTNLSSVGFDEETNTLEIGFNSGYVYQYFGVPLRVYTSLMYAGSKGTYFDKYIRKRGYPCRRVW